MFNSFKLQKMKKPVVIVIFVLVWLAFSCEIEKSENTRPVNPVVTGISYVGCKELDLKCTRNEDCVIYETVNDSSLKINRINAAFNCCFDYLLINIETADNSTIKITEKENAGLCNCICLYDIEYTVGPLNYGLYSIDIYEQSGDTISFNIDFNKDTSGEYCEERTGYPWN
jgi:hypothetical protein